VEKLHLCFTPAAAAVEVTRGVAAGRQRDLRNEGRSPRYAFA
jgi:hypothetical protein